MGAQSPTYLTPANSQIQFIYIGIWLKLKIVQVQHFFPNLIIQIKQNISNSKNINENEHSTATNIMNLKHLNIVTILLDHGNIALVYSKN